MGIGGDVGFVCVWAGGWGGRKLPSELRTGPGTPGASPPSRISRCMGLTLRGDGSSIAHSELKTDLQLKTGQTLWLPNPHPKPIAPCRLNRAVFAETEALLIVRTAATFPAAGFPAAACPANQKKKGGFPRGEFPRRHAPRRVSPAVCPVR